MSAQDMTPQLERERQLAAQLVSPHERVRLQAAESLIARAWSCFRQGDLILRR